MTRVIVVRNAEHLAEILDHVMNGADPTLLDMNQAEDLLPPSEPFLRAEMSWRQAQGEDALRRNFEEHVAKVAAQDAAADAAVKGWDQPQALLPTDRQARKEVPLARCLFDYFPAALAAVAHVSFVGNRQHNGDSEPFWAYDKSTDEADCLLRHFAERGTIDTDGLPHSAKVAWRALAMLERELVDSGQAPMPRGARYSVAEPAADTGAAPPIQRLEDRPYPDHQGAFPQWPIDANGTFLKADHEARIIAAPEDLARFHIPTRLAGAEVTVVEPEWVASVGSYGPGSKVREDVPTPAGPVPVYWIVPHKWLASYGR